MGTMPRRFLIPLIALGAAVLVLIGAIGALAIAGDDESGSVSKGTNKGYLGLRVSAMAFGGGLRVAEVESDGPAADAGIQVGDVVRAVDGKIVRTPEELRSTVEAKSPGTTVTITYERGDDESRAEVKLAEAPENAEVEASPTQQAGGPGRALGQGRARLGVTLAQITPELKSRYNLQRDSGVVITEVARRTPAADAGLLAGDIILEVAGRQVTTVDEVTRAVAAAALGQAASIKVLRGSSEMTVQATLRSALDPLEELSPQLQERLRQAFPRAAQSGLKSGIVKQVSVTSLTLTPVDGGDEFSVGITDQTEFRRGVQKIGVSDIQTGETVIVISTDGGKTAMGVLALGRQAELPQLR